ncbi:YciE/YciF ferroxidase family protein [Candidatus Laterigemmans baculatus]|uniref:YciE/YciF ferroxidase family protein n=1 Tax=Candidatus Laterigemmans baculatus TaxID=2770505 RepID=UPI0013D9F529|nr:ferritin-like domain-containing protein [Candidatus Laterigemmans baculatus]
MALFSKTYNTLEELFWDQIKDLYDAEHRIADALPKMAEAASSAHLRAAFETHLGETKQQIERLESVFRMCDRQPERETCPAAKGLIAEGSEIISAHGDSDVRDAGLIAAAQRVEHYEIAGYGTARSLAQRLGLTRVAEILQTTLDEEGATDKKLTTLATSEVNVAAAHH